MRPFARSSSAALAALLLAAGCAPAPRGREAAALPVDVYADTGRTVTLAAPPPAAPRAEVWLTRVAPARFPAPSPEPPEAPVESLGSDATPPALEVDDDLKPPLPRGRAPLAVPAGAPPGVVELDVRVDELGAVTDALPAGGSDDPRLVRAATECALAMRFYPAQRAGRPVAVWCRQRFDFGAAR